jgi:hypothetical protein
MKFQSITNIEELLEYCWYRIDDSYSVQIQYHIIWQLVLLAAVFIHIGF